MAEKKLQNGNKFKTKTRLEGSRRQAARRRSKATASRPSGAYKWHGHMINTVAVAFAERQLETELE